MSKALERVPVRLQSNVQPNAVMEDNKVASRRLENLQRMQNNLQWNHMHRTRVKLLHE